MQEAVAININQEFAEDVKTGLTNYPKRLSSKYFYNEVGDQLFQRIMKLSEYYLTRAEYQVFDQWKHEILNSISPEKGDQFELVELGAGDGYKTKVLLRYFLSQRACFEYLPIDISQNALDGLELSLGAEIPNLNVRAIQGDYFHALTKLDYEQIPKLILFMGSNIGNFGHDDASKFLAGLGEHMKSFDRLLVGIDLKKDPQRILDAYNDSEGVTAEFNFNLLDRINEELEGNFDRNQFVHSPTYDPESGECRSYLLSKTDQKVVLDALDLTIEFEAWEPIHMEISKKYSLMEFKTLIKESGFEIERVFTDTEKLFADVLLKRAR